MRLTRLEGTAKGGAQAALCAAIRTGEVRDSRILLPGNHNVETHEFIVKACKAFNGEWIVVEDQDGSPVAVMVTRTGQNTAHLVTVEISAQHVPLGPCSAGEAEEVGFTYP